MIRIVENIMNRISQRIQNLKNFEIKDLEIDLVKELINSYKNFFKKKYNQE